MTLPEFYRLCRYWSRHPPVHLMVAAYLGIKPRTETPIADIGDLLRMVPGGQEG